jgi:predicted amidohydrolase
MRIALANLPYPATPADSVERVVSAVSRAGAAGASIVCFPECYVPGYRGLGHAPPPPDGAFLEGAWSAIAAAAAKAGVAVVLGTERLVGGKLFATALVIDAQGQRLGFQDKVQVAPGEDYSPAEGRQVFRVGELTLGVAICHEGFRYPETVRFAAKRGAQLVFHPHLEEAEPGSHRPVTFAEAANTFHEKAVLCRAAENTCYVASVNYASAGSPTTSAVANPDGTVLAWQPYGQEGLLIAELELAKATGFLASRCRS